MLYLLLSVVLYSLNNLLWKKVLQQADSWLIMASRAFLTTIIGIIVILLHAPEIVFQINLNSVFSVTIASVLGALGLICMITALKKGTLRQLGIFNLVSIAFTVSYLFLFENFNFLDFLLGTSLIIVGFSIYVFQIKKLPTGEYNFEVLINFTLMALFFASSGLVHWYNLKQSIPPLFSVVNQELVVFLVAITSLLFQPKSKKASYFQMIKKSSIFLGIMAILIFTAVWTGFLGLKITNPLLASVLPLASPILTILFGALFFKEKWNKNIILSLLIITIGAFVLHFNTK